MRLILASDRVPCTIQKAAWLVGTRYAVCRAGPDQEPAAWVAAAQLDISQLPEILCAQRRHLAQLGHYQWQEVDTAISDATRAIYQALRGGIWIPGQRQRLQQLAPGTWDQALSGVLGSHRRQDDDPGHPAVEIAIYPDVVWLAARSLREHGAGHHAAS